MKNNSLSRIFPGDSTGDVRLFSGVFSTPEPYIRFFTGFFTKLSSGFLFSAFISTEIPTFRLSRIVIRECSNSVSTEHSRKSQRVDFFIVL